MGEHTICLNNVSYEDIARVGGKAASLGEMLRAKMPVPPGFVITTAAYTGGYTDQLERKIISAFELLAVKRVAVRSSAVCEDSANASWAGQLESVLNVTRGNLKQAVEYCWESIRSARAQSYAKENNVFQKRQAVAVVVQAMVDSSVSGVVFTANPVNYNPEEAVIEVIYGLGELLVQGRVTPESYVVNGNNGEVLNFYKHRQTKMLIYKNGKNQEVAVPQTHHRIINDSQVQKILKLAKQIEAHYGTPQDIEFAIEHERIYIVQSRPITTIRQ